MNAIDLELATALAEAVRAATTKESVRIIVLSASGRMFCAGGDLRYFGTAAEPAQNRIDGVISALHSAVLHLARSPALVVALVNGTSAGAGFSLAAGADYVIASDTAKFVSAYTAAGLSPDGGLSWFLPRLIGLRRARTMMLNNIPLTAAQALQLGIIDEITPLEDLEASGHARIAQFLAGPPGAFAQVKALVGDVTALEQHLLAEREAMIAQFTSSEGAEGISAYLGKRTPNFN